MPISAQAAAIAAQVDAACTQLDVVHATIPNQIAPRSAVVAPAPDWGTTTAQSFCGPDLNWEVIIVASIANYATSMDWLFDRVTEMLASTDLDVASWSQPERIDSGASDALAVRVRLAPRPLEE